MVSAKPYQALAPTHGFEPGLLTSAPGAGPTMGSAEATGFCFGPRPGEGGPKGSGDSSARLSTGASGRAR